MTQAVDRVLELVERFERLIAADSWAGDLNPVQRLALHYLARANRFSRTPTAVAAYLSATKGTVSQTLRALERAGLVASQRDPADRRSTVYALTGDGRAALRAPLQVAEAARRADAGETAELVRLLERLLLQAIAARGGRPFGLCGDCRSFRRGPDGGFCSLLQVALNDADAEQICVEQEPA